MIQTSTASADPIAMLEIGGGRLPARMVAGRIRADLPRQLPLASLPARRLRLAMLLLVVAVPLFGVTRRRRATTSGSTRG